LNSQKHRRHWHITFSNTE